MRNARVKQGLQDLFLRDVLGWIAFKGNLPLLSCDENPIGRCATWINKLWARGSPMMELLTVGVQVRPRFPKVGAGGTTNLQIGYSAIR